MVSNEFKRLRSRLDRTQKEMAQLLGVSIKAIHSYEQGWRKIPGHLDPGINACIRTSGTIDFDVLIYNHR